MAVAQTKAAEIMQQRSSELTAHQVISLLLDGALERVAQAKACVEEGNEEDKAILIAKIIAIVNGLRNSLNLEQGGDIAINLDNLYDYITNRLVDIERDQELLVLTEVGNLVEEVKSGWDAIEVGPQPQVLSA